MHLYINTIHSKFWRCFASLSLCATVVSCGPPQDVAVASRSQVAGSVYSVKLLWKGPLYVKSFNTLEGSSLASAAGALIGNAAANSSRNGSEWRELTREGARLGSDLVENRKKNGQCQYLLETDDECLIQRVNPRYIIDDGRPDADQLQLQSRIASTEQEIQILERQLNEAIFKLNEDRENRELAGLATAIDSLVSEKIEILGLIDARIQKQNEPKKHEAVITVFNPCRDFEVGENVLVMDAGFGNIILEKNEIGL